MKLRPVVGGQNKTRNGWQSSPNRIPQDPKHRQAWKERKKEIIGTAALRQLQNPAFADYYKAQLPFVRPSSNSPRVSGFPT